MAKINPTSLVATISGKSCSHDNTYFKTNKQTGNVYAVRLCNPSDAKATAKQEAHRKEFGKKSTISAQWLAANRPSESNSNKGSEAYIKVLRSYKSQHKVGNIMIYVRSLINDEGKVMLGGVDITGGITPGNSSNPGGVVEG